jgi:thiamine monophosphate synthase
VYFLGGMGEVDLSKTLALGAQGIAGVSAFWNIKVFTAREYFLVLPM